MVIMIMLVFTGIKGNTDKISLGNMKIMAKTESLSVRVGIK